MKRHKYNARKAYRCIECGADREAAPLGFCPFCQKAQDAARFDSQAEARRWDVLRTRIGRGAGDIAAKSIERQVVFPLYAKNQNVEWSDPVGRYVADFRYRLIGKPNQRVVEDVKGVDTPLSKWKRKHCELQYGIKIEVIKA